MKMKRQATELENLAIHMANNGVNQKTEGMLTNQEEKEKPSGNMSWSLEQVPQNKYMKTCGKIQFQTMMMYHQNGTKGLKVKTKASTSSSGALIHWQKYKYFLRWSNPLGTIANLLRCNNGLFIIQENSLFLEVTH